MAAAGSPRQKMINMMYLVLTALLALNVSADILKSFQLLADALNQTGNRFSEKNHVLAKGIRDALKKEASTGNTNNQYLLPYIEEVEKKADELVAVVEKQVEELLSDHVGGKDPETGLMAKPDESESNMHHWMGAMHEGRGEGAAKKLRDDLNGYVDWANKFFETKLADKDGPKKVYGTDGFQQICVDPKDDKLLAPRVKAEHENESWEYYTFHGPAIANMAMLMKFKTDINVIEGDLLDAIRRKLGDVPIKIDSLEGFGYQTSNTVVAGTKMQVHGFVGTYMKDVKPSFQGATKTEKGGNEGVWDVMGNAGSVPAGKDIGTQTWSYNITVPWKGGTTKTLNIKGEFKVVLPSIDIKSTNVLALYEGCYNEMEVGVPILGADYNPTFTATGGEAQQKAPGSKVVGLIPSIGSKEMKLTVNSLTNGQNVSCGTKTFGVRTPPKPTIQIFAGGSEVPGGATIPKPGKISIKCIADKQFRETLPNEAKYQMEGITATSKASAFGTAMAFMSGGSSSTGPEAVAEASTMTANMPSGALVVIKIDKVSRVNYKGQKIPDNRMTLSDLQRSFSIK